MAKATLTRNIKFIPKPAGALVYRLIPSHSAVSVRWVNGSLVPDVAKITFRITRQTGDDTPVTVTGWTSEGLSVGFSYLAGDTTAHQYAQDNSGVDVIAANKGISATLMRSGAVVDSVTVPFTIDGQAGVTYELMCIEPIVHVASDGTISPETISVQPYKIIGGSRVPLPVNAESGSQHYLIRRYMATNTVVGALGKTISTQSYKSAKFSARLDLVAKADVADIQSCDYPDSAVLASFTPFVQRDGSDGGDGALSSNVFKRAATQPATPTGGTYDNPIPDGWSDAPPEGTDPLWMSRARFTPDTTDPGWSTPSLVADSTGIEFIFSSQESPAAPANTHPYPDTAGAVWNKQASDAVWMAVAAKNAGAWSDWKVTRIKGEKGPAGSRGPALRGPQDWASLPAGYQFQSGADGEQYLDIVVYNGNYFSCSKSHSKTVLNYPMSSAAEMTTPKLWTAASKFEVIATKILLASYALVKNLGVEALEMKDAAGNVICTIKDGNVTCNTGTFKNVSVAGDITADTLSLKINTASETQVPNGSLLLDASEIVLPALAANTTRSIKILNKFASRAGAQSLVLSSNASNVYFAKNLDWLNKSSSLTVAAGGANSGKFFELLGVNDGVSGTVWYLIEIASIPT